jgi:hypothetical protein
MTTRIFLYDVRIFETNCPDTLFLGLTKAQAVALVAFLKQQDIAYVVKPKLQPASA